MVLELHGLNVPADVDNVIWGFVGLVGGEDLHPYFRRVSLDVAYHFLSLLELIL